MSKEKNKVVTLRPMGNKIISKEPEIIEIKRMVQDGELDSIKTVEHLKTMEKASEQAEKARRDGGADTKKGVS